MPLVSGLKKLFAKKEKFAPLDKYLLSSTEKEQILVFFACIAIAILAIGITLAMNIRPV